MGIWKPKCLCGASTWISESQCVFCNIHSKSVRSILLCWSNRYWHDMSGYVATVDNPIPTFIYKQDRSPAHFHCEVLQYLNTVLPGRWIGRASGNEQPLLLRPPEVPWYYALWFFLLGYVKNRVFFPPLPRDLAELKVRIIAAAKNIDVPMLTRVWQEFNP